MSDISGDRVFQCVDFIGQRLELINSDAMRCKHVTLVHVCCKAVLVVDDVDYTYNSRVCCGWILLDSNLESSNIYCFLELYCFIFILAAGNGLVNLQFL